MLSKCRLQHPWSIAALICLGISRRQPSAVRGAGTDVSQQASVQVRGHLIETLTDALTICWNASERSDEAVSRELRVVKASYAFNPSASAAHV